MEERKQPVRSLIVDLDKLLPAVMAALPQTEMTK
jgi:hypothetical protein